MPDPDEFSFHTPGPKGPGVRVGEEFEFRLTPEAELKLRVQALERAISRVPFLGLDYARELKRVGLEKSDLKLMW